MSFSRVAAVSGFIAVVLTIVSVALVGDRPGPGDPVAQVVEYLNEDAGMHRASTLFGALIVPFFMVFVAGIVSKVRDNDRKRGEAWAISALAGSVLMAAALGTGDILTGVLFLRGGDGLDESSIRAIYDTAYVAYSSAGVAVALFTGSVAVAAIRYRFFPAWYGWLSALVAVLGFVSVAGVQWASDTGEVVGTLPLPGLLVFMLATSVLMYRSGGQAD